MNSRADNYIPYDVKYRMWSGDMESLFGEQEKVILTTVEICEAQNSSNRLLTLKVLNF